jgi:hypothetical protein
VVLAAGLEDGSSIGWPMHLLVGGIELARGIEFGPTQLDEDLARPVLPVAGIDDDHRKRTLRFLLHVDEARIQELLHCRRGILRPLERGEDRAAGAKPAGNVRLRMLVMHTDSA